jgi:UDP-2,3-diacylglucosamine pyrophosphatase LpxH
MLLAISDLHLTDETVSDAEVTGRALETVLNDLASSAEAHNRHGGAPIDELEVLLLGDMFDLLRTSYWSQIPESECPWAIELIDGDGTSPAAARVVAHAGAILDGILAAPNASDVCAALLGAVTHGLGPFKSVRIQFICGNHDRLINHRAAGALRAKVRAALGIKAADATALFPYSLYNEEHQTFSRHGHEFDPWNFEPLTIGEWSTPAYERCPIGDPITFALVTKIYLEIRKTLDPAQVIDPNERAERQRLLDGLQAIEDVRPISLIPVWLKSYLQNHALGDVVCRVVPRVAKEFRSLRYFDWWRDRSVWDTPNPFQRQDLFAGIIRLLAHFEQVPAKRLAKLYKFYGRSSNDDSILPGLVAEPIITEPDSIRARPVRHMLCGHTHDPEVSLATVIDLPNWARRCQDRNPAPEAPRDVAHPGGRQVWYLNTGTMRNRVLLSGDSTMRFSPIENLSYVVIYRPGEKFATGFAADLWSGSRAPIET